MTVRIVNRHPHRYYDSVMLMRVSQTLQSLPGVRAAWLLMGTPMNVELLAEDGYQVEETNAGDLMVALEAEERADAEAALEKLEQLLRPTDGPSGTAREIIHRSTERAMSQVTEGEIAVIAVPGEFASIEAWTALRQGMHPFIFSDNVPLEDEIALKRAGLRDGLLVMGPDCGTAIIGGVGFGFANRVRPGSIGLVGASGTGLQQVASLLHAGGTGVAVAIGTGSRDLSSQVDGVMTLAAIQLLAEDHAVEKICLVSKPGDDRVARRVLDCLASAGKPAVACLLGYKGEREGVILTETLAGAARALLVQPCEPKVSSPAHAERAHDPVGVLIGLYCGGTLCEEARRIAARSGTSLEARFIDTGADEYTRGRAHPMIDPRLRAGMIEEAGNDADVILFDVVLGDLAHPDPAGAVVPAISAAREYALKRNRDLKSFCALIGTDLDPQGLAFQRDILEAAGVVVASCNEEAAVHAVNAAGQVGG